MNSGHIDPNDAGLDSSASSQQQSSEGYPGWRMKLGSNIFEMLLALWNFLGWKFDGEIDKGIVVDPDAVQKDPRELLKEDRDKISTEAYSIEGRLFPRFYSPVYWIHLLWGLTFHSHFFLTSLGRKYFWLYYNVFLAGKEGRKELEMSTKGREDPNNILLPFNKDRSNFWNAIRARVIMYTRMDEYYFDISKCDQDYSGRFHRYILDKIITMVILRPIILLEFPFIIYDREIKKRSLEEFQGVYFRIKNGLGLNRYGTMFIYTFISLILWCTIIWGIMNIL